MKARTDEIIYEWGKSLIHFNADETIRSQVSGSTLIGWDTRKNKGFSGKKTIADVEQKTGGTKDWTKISNGGNGKWNTFDLDYSLIDQKDAEEQAQSRLRESSYEYIRAEGSGEGNNKLLAGMPVMLKMVGAAYTGEYIAENVTHEFSLEEGYITGFGLKRNMVDEGFQKGNTVVDKQAAAANAGQGAAAAADSTDEDEEEEPAPEFSNLRWLKDGEEITEALVDDEVTLACDVKNINN
jgi:hypothetical protein